MTFKRTPILVADGSFDASPVLRLFLTVRNALPEEILAFVGKRIRRYPEETTQNAWPALAVTLAALPV